MLSGRVYALKTVRLFYKKQGRARYISHLDTMRAMTRMLRRANLPVWYTEGFNPHLYVTFAFPLSLGFQSDCEIADIRLTDDGFPTDGICETLNSTAPDGFYFFAASKPVKKLSDLSFASFCIEFEDGGNLAAPLEEFLKSDCITVEKKTKKGGVKTIDIAPDIESYSVEKNGGTTLYITLPAGPAKTLNPELLIDKFLLEQGCKPYINITRTALLDGDKNPLV